VSVTEVAVTDVSVAVVSVVAVVVVVQASHSTGHVASNAFEGVGSSFANSHNCAVYLAHSVGSGAPWHNSVVVVTVVAVVVPGHASHSAGHAAVTSLPTNRSSQKWLPSIAHCSGSALPSQVPSTVAVFVVAVFVVAVVVGIVVVVVVLVDGGGGGGPSSHVLHSTGHLPASGNGRNPLGSSQ